jgi:hypothetical protein
VTVVRQRNHVLPASRGSVTSFPGREYGVAARVGAREIANSAIAGNGHVFPANAAVAEIFGCRNRSGDLVGIDTPIGCGLCKIA